MTEETAQTEVEEMLAKGYVPAVVDKLTVIKADPGDFLVFQMKAKLSHEAMRNLTQNFDRYLNKNRLRGIFLPMDIDLVAVLNAPDCLRQIEAVVPPENQVS